MDAKAIFLIIPFVIIVFIWVNNYLKGKSALAIFPDIEDDQIKFRDKRASGYSTKSLKTKLGGVRNCLDIVVTNDELWLKCGLLFSFGSEQSDLLHRIPFTSINRINENGNKITIDFTSMTGENKQVAITTKRPKEFLSSVKVIHNQDNNNIAKSDEFSFSGITKKQKYFLIPTLFLIVGTIVFFQYKSLKDKHERLASIGQIAPIISEFSSVRGVDYASYYFITENGKKIEGYEKCGQEYDEYISGTAIYNPNDPSDYELSFHFDKYSPTWQIIFFFFIILPGMLFFTYQVTNFGVTIFKAINSYFNSSPEDKKQKILVKLLGGDSWLGNFKNF